MKITLYTITDCQFSKQEKEYLSSHSLSFEEKNLETNRDFLTEMLAVSNNFAGTPVTKIEKDDGQIVVLKGFTKDEFDKTLGLANPVPPAKPVAPIPQSPVQPISPPAPVTPSVDMPAPIPPPPTPPPSSQPVPPPEKPSTSPNPMNSVLDNLQQQASATPPLPSIPDPKL